MYVDRLGNYWVTVRTSSAGTFVRRRDLPWVREARLTPRLGLRAT